MNKQKFVRMSKEEIFQTYGKLIENHIKKLREETDNWKLDHALIKISGIMRGIDLSINFLPKKYIRIFYNYAMLQIYLAIQERLTVSQIIEKILRRE